MEKKLSAAKKRITLKDGRELQYHSPLRNKAEAIPLLSLLPKDLSLPLEVEIGPGKGEFISHRARQFPERFFVGIDRRVDRSKLSEKKLKRGDSELEKASNWLILNEDARCFLEAGLPSIYRLHIYHPDPWPKARHHKNRFFRSPDACTWARAIMPGGALSLSTDHEEYFGEILEILECWDFMEPVMIMTKTAEMGPAVTHFEKIFFNKNEPVYKAIYRRKI
jgi:tRNA (guanine-N7-)-methyltransferase